MLQTMNIPKIMEDELFATYLDRLAESNGFISTNKFLMNILGEIFDYVYREKCFNKDI